MRSKKRTVSNARQISAVLLGQDGVGKSGKELLQSLLHIPAVNSLTRDTGKNYTQPQPFHLFVKVLFEIQ